jgi:uncharacterized protein YjbJ (UPF0337 family)
MRFLFRLAVLALAAVGAKSLYDRYAPQASDLRGSAGSVLGSAKDAARSVAGHAKNAAGEVADDARHRAGEVRDQAAGVVEYEKISMSDDAPTIVTEVQNSF